MTYKCVVCAKPLPNYKPVMCCRDPNCACGGRPVEPITCSLLCTAKVLGTCSCLIYDGDNLDCSIHGWAKETD